MTIQRRKKEDKEDTTESEEGEEEEDEEDDELEEELNAIMAEPEESPKVPAGSAEAKLQLAVQSQGQVQESKASEFANANSCSDTWEKGMVSLLEPKVCFQSNLCNTNSF